MQSRFVQHVLLIGMLFLIGGCQVTATKWSGNCQVTATKWSGSWVDLRAEDHGGDLHCVANQMDDATWKARFSGFCGRDFAYDIEMHGRQKGDKVVFAGDVDLGEEDGGVYTWTGHMAGDQFVGQYATKDGKAGTFEMTRR
mgnify:CR=1 FL=1